MTRSSRRTAETDRVVTSLTDRRNTILQTIRGAERRLSLSLFRCNDKEIFAELAGAVERGVEVEILTTARAKGGRKRLEKLWKRLERTGATVHAYTDPVVKYHAKYLVADDGPAIVASLNFTKKCFDRGAAPPDGRRPGRTTRTRQLEPEADHRSGARPPAADCPDRSCTVDDPRDRREGVGPRFGHAAQRAAR